MKKVWQYFSAILASFVVAAAATLPAVAATSSTATTATGTGNGYRISPVRTDLTVNPGSSKTVQVYIKNVTADAQNLDVLINDFTTNDMAGTPALYMNNQNAPQHSLRQYTSVSPKTLTVQPGEQASVNVTVTIPSGAKAGGYFGAVRFAPSNLAGSKTVNLSASVASLLLVTVPGNYSEQLAVSDFSVTQQGKLHSIFRTPKNLQAVATFKNTGDVQEEPFGKVLVQKGKNTVSSVEINNTDPRGNVLPESSRVFKVDLSKVGSFGKYTVVGNFGYGKGGQLITAKTTFYVIPLGVILVVLVVLLVLVFLVFVLPRIIRRHDQRVLRQSGRR